MQKIPLEKKNSVTVTDENNIDFSTAINKNESPSSIININKYYEPEK